LRDDAYYLDDFLDQEATAVLGDTLLRSDELLQGLEAAGVVSVDEAERIRRNQPNVFDRPGRVPARTLNRGLVISGASLLVWYDTGLLRKWLRGTEGWPKFVVGPWAAGDLRRNVTEAQRYKDALQK